MYGKKNASVFHKKVINSSWQPFFDTYNVDHALDTFYFNINKAFYSSFPLKRLSLKRANDKEWITSSIKKCIHKKEAKYKKMP